MGLCGRETAWFHVLPCLPLSGFTSLPHRICYYPWKVLEFVGFLHSIRLLPVLTIFLYYGATSFLSKASFHSAPTGMMFSTLHSNKISFLMKRWSVLVQRSALLPGWKPFTSSLEPGQCTLSFSDTDVSQEDTVWEWRPVPVSCYCWRRSWVL
jgi:hypothetical protein